MLRLLKCAGRPELTFEPIGIADLPRVRADVAVDQLTWVDATAPTAEELDALAEAFDLHPLVRDDLGQADQRQKAEMFGDDLLVVVHLPHVEQHGDEPRLTLVEIDCVLGDHWLVTSHANDADVSEQTALAVASRQDLAAHGSMAAGTALLDQLVDRYEQLVDTLAEAVDEQDRELLDERGSDPLPSLRRTAHVRHAVLQLRRSTGQLRELVGVLVRHELAMPGASDELDLELRDVYDHTIRAHDDLDLLYERLASLADTRLAITAYRQNDITKRLSAWGAILLVPTVVTGWFGMNFRHLSLLGWPSGEWLALGFVVGVCGALFGGFRRAGWL